MLTTQSAVTVIAEILPGHEAALQQALEQAGQSPASNASVPFARLTGVHFARFFILPPATDLDGRPLAARLVFLADTDSPPGAFLRAVSALAPDGLDRLYAHCRGYPGRSGVEPELVDARRDARQDQPGGGRVSESWRLSARSSPPLDHSSPDSST